MRINGKAADPIYLYEVEEIIYRVSREHYDGNVITDRQSARQLSSRSVNLRLKVSSSRDVGARRSWSGRRMPAACWHAYRDVIRAILTAHPTATIRTGMAVYKGLEGFEETYPDTAYKNIGSIMQPAYMPNLCECTDPTPTPTPTPEPTSEPEIHKPEPEYEYDILQRIDATLGHVYEDSTGELFYVPDTR